MEFVNSIIFTNYTPISNVLVCLLLFITFTGNISNKLLYKYFFDKDLVFHEFDFLRPFTAALFFNFISFKDVVNFFYFIKNLSDVEMNFYRRRKRKSDFTFFIVFIWFFNFLIAIVLDLEFFSRNIEISLMIFSLLTSSSTDVSMYGLKIPVKYYPFILILSSVFNGFKETLITILSMFIGGFFYLFSENTNGRRYFKLEAPYFFKYIFGETSRLNLIENHIVEFRRIGEQ